MPAIVRHRLQAQDVGHPVLRSFGRFHGAGVAALYRREMLRALKIWKITVVAPVLRAALFAGIFALVVRDLGETMGGMPFLDFLLPGLIAAAVLEKAFEANAFAIVFDKMEGVIVDILEAPLTAAEVTLAYVAAAVSGGLLTGICVWLALLPFGAPLPAAPALALFYAAAGAAITALFGLITGIWADKWDRLSAVQTFAFIPILFLSGVFFSVERLPPLGQLLAQANPLFYVIDGVRYGLTGHAESNLWLGAVILLALIAALAGLAHRMLATGYKLKP